MSFDNMTTKLEALLSNVKVSGSGAETGVADVGELREPEWWESAGRCRNACGNGPWTNDEAPPDVSPGGASRHPMGQGGLEPPTSRLSGVRSNHLSYWPATCKPEE